MQNLTKTNVSETAAGLYSIRTVADTQWITTYVFSSSISGLVTGKRYDSKDRQLLTVQGSGVASVGILTTNKFKIFFLVSNPEQTPQLIELKDRRIICNFRKLNEASPEGFADSMLRSTQELRKRIRSEEETLLYVTPGGLVVISSGSHATAKLVLAAVQNVVQDQRKQKHHLPEFVSERLISQLKAPAAILTGRHLLPSIRSITVSSEKTCRVERNRVNVEFATHETGKADSLSVRCWLTPPGMNRAS
jgi:hypothetical protein